jgi:hypothetical protein
MSSMSSSCSSSSSPARARKERACAEGFAVHVTKPFKSDVLVDLVKWISRKKPRAVCRARD